MSPGKRAAGQWAQWEAAGDILDGRLARHRLKDFLTSLQLTDAEVVDAMRPMEGPGSGNSEEGLTFEQTSALISAVEAEPPSPEASSSAPLTASPSGLMKAPFKKILSKNRDYLGTGHLVTDEAVLMYIRKLEEHRKRCESENRYLEAKAAASRLADLKTAQV